MWNAARLLCSISGADAECDKFFGSWGYDEWEWSLSDWNLDEMGLTINWKSTILMNENSRFSGEKNY